ncbi:MAG: GlsB/YeaQ/YmgE family stress response membrane protein [Candidatus Eremiobacteraeota bacterium]|nr:GlsB/YeaQ/YmgE family stress response membrane protein [Candidatus Eremiobacteraeota bacterium]
MGILLWIIFGIIVGAVARWIVPGEGPGGVIGDLVIGIVGALLGGWIFSLFGHVGVTGFNVGSFITAIIGAVVLLFIVRAVSGRRTVA